jgi:NodT family efflux transporter outer membrane factor (OMF) lipoprotein
MTMTRQSSIALLLLASAALAACDIGPDYKRPDLNVPQKFDQAPGGPDLWPSVTWWQGFGSPQLDAFEKQAMQANFDLAAAVAQVREADAQAKIAGAALLPTASLGADATQARSTGQGSKRSTGPTYSVEPSASYEVDFWGKNRASVAAAEATARASHYNQQTVAITVASSVATTYFEIAGLQDQIAIAQDNLKSATSVLRAVTAQRAAGTATQLDIAQQTTVVKQLTAVIPPLQAQLVQNRNALAILLGENPEQLALAQSSLTGLRVPAVAPGMPSELLLRRPDVREAEAQLVAANANIKVARAELFPSIQLTAAGGFESTALTSLFQPQSALFSLAAGLTQPIFAGGALQGQVENVRARYDELTQDYRKAVASSFSDAETALANVAKTGEEMADQDDATNSARQAFTISQAQYKAGTITLLTVLSTQTTLFQAQNALVQDKLAYIQAVVALFKALGGGWKDDGSPSGP